jgi:hypothetical protein
MSLSIRCAVVLSIILLLAFASGSQSAAFDPKALEQTINLDLRDASMPDAVAMVANAADIWIVGPGEPARGIIITLNNRTVRDVLDGLATATGTAWNIQDDMVIFTKPPESSAEQKKPPKRTEPLSPEQGMAEMIASLGSNQFYAVSDGYPMGYTDMSPYQQDILKSMLASPTVAVSQAGDVVKDLPAPDTVSVYFATLPYLVVPNPDGKGTMTIRLDTTDYMYLKRVGK